MNQHPKKSDYPGWLTTDALEIVHRKERAQREKMDIAVITSGDPYFNIFSLTSSHGQSYRVEIRSLLERLNSCDCFDFQTNQLGTCKHIEGVLFYLASLGIRKFKQAANKGTPWVEIYWDSIDSTIKISCTDNHQIHDETYQALRDFFTPTGILESPLKQWAAVKHFLLVNKKSLTQVRLSVHAQDYAERLQRDFDKQSQHKALLEAVQHDREFLNVLRSPLYDYQQKGMLHLISQERALLADSMGLGKNIQALAACVFLKQHRDIKKVLVITTASIKSEWKSQIDQFTRQSLCVVQGSHAKRLHQYQQSAFFYLTHYEQIVRDKAAIQAYLAPDVIILDEVQRIKHWRNRAARVIKSLKSRYAFVLTGTPLENRLDDLYSIVQFLNPYLFGAVFRFNRIFYQLDEQGKPIGYQNLEKLHQTLQPILLRRRKHDVVDQLPERTVTYYFVPMSEEQQTRYEAYQARVAKLIYEGKQRVLTPEESKRIQQYLACMRMLCDTPYLLDAQCQVCPKLTELKKILEELLIEPSTKIIIFSEWTRMLGLVLNLLQDLQVDSVFHVGSVPQQKRSELIQRFKTDPHCRIFLSTDIGSLGLNLQVANVVINMDLPWNPVKLEQRIARAWRKHQTKVVQVIHLISENTIEHRMVHLLQKKQALASNVLEHVECSEIPLPSAGKAFIEWMDTLLETPMVEEHIPAVSEPDIAPNFPRAVIAHFDQKLQWLGHYKKIADQQTWLAVIEGNATLVQKELEKLLAPYLVSGKTAPQIEVLDPQTYNCLQRLAKNGLLKLDAALMTAYQAPIAKESRQQQDHLVQISQPLLKKADHQYRIAEVLIQGDFHEEALIALRTSLEQLIIAFAVLHGVTQSTEEVSLSQIQETLVQKKELPQEIFIWIARYRQPEQPIVSKEAIVAHSQQVALLLKETNALHDQLSRNECNARHASHCL